MAGIFILPRVLATRRSRSSSRSRAGCPSSPFRIIKEAVQEGGGKGNSVSVALLAQVSNSCPIATAERRHDERDSDASRFGAEPAEGVRGASQHRRRRHPPFSIGSKFQRRMEGKNHPSTPQRQSIPTRPVVPLRPTRARSPQTGRRIPFPRASTTIGIHLNLALGRSNELGPPHSAAAVRVLPVPVAISTRSFRRPFRIWADSASTHSIW